METELHKANTRGQFNYGWLDTKHTFSFARYSNPDRNGFGALRVLNDDIIKPGEGFGRHPHDNMEIISIPIQGKILHRDSMNFEQVLSPGEVQVLSAGSGIFHEEYNESNNGIVNFLQIWIIPNQYSTTPSYSQKEFDSKMAINTWQELVSPFNKEALPINQNAIVSRTFLSEKTSINYKLKSNSNGSYLFLIDGSIRVENIILNNRDGIGISDKDEFTIESVSDSYILNIEVPL